MRVPLAVLRRVDVSKEQLALARLREQAQRRLLFEMGLHFATSEAEKRMYEKSGAEDEDVERWQLRGSRQLRHLR